MNSTPYSVGASSRGIKFTGALLSSDRSGCLYLSMALWLMPCPHKTPDDHYEARDKLTFMRFMRQNPRSSNTQNFLFKAVISIRRHESQPLP